MKRHWTEYPFRNHPGLNGALFVPMCIILGVIIGLVLGVVL